MIDSLHLAKEAGSSVSNKKVAKEKASSAGLYLIMTGY
jgi:hypothetical protein